jgi:N-methylhydantoinase B/oxoprolinase/acetone carboxylase alpha subunit
VIEKVDIAALNILDNHLISICREMGHVLMRTSYSSIFNEGLDFTCAFANTRGETIAVAEFCPAQIGAMPVTIEACVSEIPHETLYPGDIIIHNDPYRGGCHLPEHSLLKPFYSGDKLFGFFVVIGHIAEVGGSAPGAFVGDATEIFQEGIRIPPVKLVNRGEDVLDVWRIMLANVRTPRFNYGDLRAMVASLNHGEGALHKMIGKYEESTVASAMDEIMDYSERWMRKEIENMPDGAYEFTDYMEDDGVIKRPYKLHVTVIIEGSSMIVDFTGTDKQATGPINANYAVTVSGVYNAVFHDTDPGIPKNSGCFRPIKIIAPPGSLVNVNYPGPEVGGNTELHPRICAVVHGALSQCIPDRTPASDGNTAVNLAFGGLHPDYNEPYSCYHLEGCGWGGRPWADGATMLCIPNGNCRNSPVEVFDTRYPWITKTYELIPDSGGAGKYRGGLGSRRIIRANASITISALGSHYERRPWGLFGGKEGSNAAMFIKRKGCRGWKTVQEEFATVSKGKFSDLKIREGDEIMIRTPGGGGYGNPRERDSGLIQRDLEEGFISKKSAKVDYGYEERCR